MNADVSWSIKILFIALFLFGMSVPQPGICSPSRKVPQQNLKGKVTSGGQANGTTSPGDIALKSLIGGLHKKSSDQWPDYGNTDVCCVSAEPRVALMRMSPNPSSPKCLPGPIFDALQEIYYGLLLKPDDSVKLMPNYMFNEGYMPKPVATWEDVRDNKSFGRADIAIAISRSGTISARVIHSTYPPVFTKNLLNSIVALSATPGTPPQTWRPKMVTMVAMFRNCDWPPPPELM